MRADSWQNVRELVDPGVEGLGISCTQWSLPIPKIGYKIGRQDGSKIAELELAWPDRSVGVAIDVADAKEAESEGWRVWRVAEALDEFEKFRAQIDR